MWFGKAVEDFNAAISEGGKNSPQLVAATSNGFVSEYSLLPSQLNTKSNCIFVVVYVAYAFYAVPLVCSLAKLHVMATAKAA